MTRWGPIPPDAAPVPRREKTPEQRAADCPTIEEVNGMMAWAQQELRKSNSDKAYWSAIFEAGKARKLELQKGRRNG